MRRILSVIGLLWSWSVAAADVDTSRPHKLLPDFVKVQYAGSIGFTSFGLGYQTRKDRLEGDLYYGYVPKSVGGVHIHALSGKGTLQLINKVKLKSIELRPLALGAVVSYTFGKQYFGFSPDNYPFSYYDFPTALHIGGFIGGRVDKVLKTGRKVGLYYELGSTDKEIASFLANRRSLHPTDILNLGVGIRTSL